MTELLEVIETTRKVTPIGDEDIPVHTHGQHYTTDGLLIVEWCTLEEPCDRVKDGSKQTGDTDE